MNKFMVFALKEAKKAYKNDDVPIGAVIVEENKIIAKAYNKKEKNNNAIDHAEMLAIKKACKKKNNWHLSNCILYTTVEPCLMCAGAMIQARIKKVVYGIPNKKFGYATSICNILNDKKNNHFVEIEQDTDCKEIETLMTTFFKSKRS